MRTMCIRLAALAAAAGLVVGFAALLLPSLSIPSFAQGPPPVSRIAAYVDLRTGQLQVVPPNNPCISVVQAPLDSNGDGWREAVLRVTLAGGNCTRAHFLLDYEGTPCGWTFNVGDASSANGFGGGSGGDSTSVAEAHITDQQLWVYTGVVGVGLVDNIANENLELKDGGLKVCVTNNSLSWGNPAGNVLSPNSRLMFQIPDTVPANFGQPAGDGNSDIWVGFNRVVSGPGGRVGTGLVRAIITLQ